MYAALRPRAPSYAAAPRPAHPASRSCVWTIYFEQRREHEEALAALTGEAPPEDPFLALERKLAEVSSILFTVLSGPGVRPAELGAEQEWMPSRPSSRRTALPPGRSSRRPLCPCPAGVPEDWGGSVGRRSCLPPPCAARSTRRLPPTQPD